jgi:hypothetical protein
MFSTAKEIQRWITKRLANVYNPFGPLRNMADFSSVSHRRKKKQQKRQY